jgi:hypothetical protein
MARTLQSEEPPPVATDKDPMQTPLTDNPTRTKPDPKALKILAKSIFKQLRTQGYEPTQILGLATEIVSLVTTDITHDPDSQG